MLDLLKSSRGKCNKATSTDVSGCEQREFVRVDCSSVKGS